MRILPRHGRRDVVARRRAVPDLPALVRGLRRRRDRRPARASWRGSTTSSGSASTASGSTRRCPRPTTTGATTSPTTAACIPTSARSRTSTRWSPRPASAGSACCSTSSRTTRATAHAVVRRRARRPRRRATATTTSGPTRRRTAGRRTTGSRTSAARPGRSHEPTRPVLPAQLPADPARPQLVERRGPRRVRRHPAVLVRPRRRRLPDRRLPRDRQGPRAARRPGRRRPTTTRRCAARGQRQVFSMNRPEVHDVLRRWRAIADAHDPPRVLVGETYVLDLDRLMPVLRRRRGRAATSRSTSSSCTPTLEARRAARRSSRASRRSCRRAPGRCTRAPTTTPAGSRRAGPATTRARARAALMMLLTLRGTPFLYYGDELGLPDVPTRPARRALDPVARRTGDPSRQPRPLPHADAVERRARRRVHRRRTRRRGCRSATSPPATSPPSARDPGSTLHLVRDLIALRRERRAT